MVCSNGACGSCTAGAGLHARDRVPDRCDLVRDGDVGLCRNGECGERDLVRDEQGVQRRRLRVLHGRGQLHARDRLPHRRDVVRDGDFGLRGNRERRERNVVREQQGVQRRDLCSSCMAGVSCTPANACRTGATSCATGASVCAETGNVTNGTSCGNNKVCNAGACSSCMAGVSCAPSDPCQLGRPPARRAPRPVRRRDRRPTERPVARIRSAAGELRGLQFGRDLFDRKCVQALGDDLLHDGQPGLCGLRQRAFRDGLRRAAVVHGRRGDAGSDLQRERELQDSVNHHVRLGAL